MLSTNEGSWKSTGPDGRDPLSASVTDWAWEVILTLNLLPLVVGKLVTEIGMSWATHWPGMPRPTIKVPSDRCATNESNRTLFAWEIPHACGEEPCPVAGCRPIHGVEAEGALELSHHEYGPLWLFSIMNS